MMKLSKAQASSDPQLKVTVYWGDILYDTAVYPPDSCITVGRKPGNTFLLDLDSPSLRDSLELIRIHPDNVAELRFDQSVAGQVWFGDKVVSLRSKEITTRATTDDEGFFRLRLSNQDRADIVLGHVSFCLNWVRERNVIPRAKRSRRSMVLWLGLFSLMLGIVGVVQYLAPPADVEKPPERIVTILPRNLHFPRPNHAPAKAAIGEKKTADGGAQKGELGKAHLAQPKVSQAAAIKNAKLGNLVKDLAQIGTEPPNGARTRSGAGAVSAISQTGTGGFSTEGLKAGGGGKSIGIGRTVGQGQGGFEGTGRLGLAGNSLVEGSSGKGSYGTSTQGGLDRDVIDSIVRRRQDRIRLCYERQLNFFPKLSGKVAVQFVIGKHGEVVSDRITEDTMANGNVSSCILSEVKGWSFPKPVGGTLVTVDYPFVFESSARSPASSK